MSLKPEAYIHEMYVWGNNSKHWYTCFSDITLIKWNTLCIPHKCSLSQVTDNEWQLRVHISH